MRRVVQATSVAVYGSSLQLPKKEDMLSEPTLVKVIGKILAKKVRPRYESARAGDIKHSLADINRAKGMGYFPKYDLEEALLETIEWFKNNKNNKT